MTKYSNDTFSQARRHSKMYFDEPHVFLNPTYTIFSKRPSLDSFLNQCFSLIPPHLRMPEAHEEVVRRVTYFLWRTLWKEYIELPTIRPKYMLPSEELDSIFLQSDQEVIAYLLPEVKHVDLALFWNSSISLLTLYVKEVSAKEPT